MKIVKLLLWHCISMLSIFFIGRLTLFIIYYDRFKDSGVDYYLSFLYGLRMDTIIVSAVLLLPVLMITLSPNIWERIISRIVKYYFMAIFVIFIYMENASIPFFAEYDVRPNYLFVEYLSYFKEVFFTVIANYKFNILLAIIMIGLFIYLYHKFTKSLYKNILSGKYWQRAVLLLPLALVLTIGIRSSFGHRPANISDAVFSSNRIVNEITKNTIYSVAYAAYANERYDSRAIDEYGSMDINEAIHRVEKCLNIKSEADSLPFFRVEKSHFPAERPKNLVILLEESLGYQFLDSNITPNLLSLSREGIFFDNLYSNGTRSVRGIAGMISGILPIPGVGVVKRNKAQDNFFNIASMLKPYGYHSLFMYGGESRFDNMKGFTIGNGFDEIIDEPKFVHPDFVGTWGVSDEDLLNRANDEFEKLDREGKPFTALIFTTSNHNPFDLPEGKIELCSDVPAESVQNAIKYADYAIGQFINTARKTKYYENTVFIIVADHNIRVYGDDIVPVNMFHIPALILGGGIVPVKIDQLVSQPDVLATGLDLIGLDLYYPILGKSVFCDDKNEISLMLFNDTYAFRKGNDVAVIEPETEPLFFRFTNEHLEETKLDYEMGQDAIAFIVTLNYLYQNRLYKQIKAPFGALNE